MYGNTESSYEIRLAIVEYVVAHWDEFKVYTCDEHGDPYIDADLYSTAITKFVRSRWYQKERLYKKNLSRLTRLKLSFMLVAGPSCCVV
ncbi:hypothetical protein SFRURICE_019577 [Spodoptera frugiperda]|nr:hypothetical protein SFRURICE_019577 [Spodoptera frugiperda]